MTRTLLNTFKLEQCELISCSEYMGLLLSFGSHLANKEHRRKIQVLTGLIQGTGHFPSILSDRSNLRILNDIQCSRQEAFLCEKIFNMRVENSRYIRWWFYHTRFFFVVPNVTSQIFRYFLGRTKSEKRAISKHWISTYFEVINMLNKSLAERYF